MSEIPEEQLLGRLLANGAKRADEAGATTSKHPDRAQIEAYIEAAGEVNFRPSLMPDANRSVARHVSRCRTCHDTFRGLMRARNEVALSEISHSLQEASADRAALTRLVLDPNLSSSVRVLAIIQLSELKEAAVIDVLEAASRDRDFMVQRSAQEALGRSQGRLLSFRPRLLTTSLAAASEGTTALSGTPDGVKAELRWPSPSRRAVVQLVIVIEDWAKQELDPSHPVLFSVEAKVPQASDIWADWLNEGYTDGSISPERSEAVIPLTKRSVSLNSDYAQAIKVWMSEDSIKVEIVQSSGGSHRNHG